MSMILSGLFTFRSKVERYLDEQPALAFLLGVLTFISMYINGLCVIWMVGVLGVILSPRHFWLQYVPIVALGYVALFFYLGEIEVQRPTSGRALIHIEEVRLSEGTFGRQWVYQGTLRKFVSEDQKVARGLPFKMYLSSKMGARPPANSDYWVNAELSKSDFYGYKLKVKKDACFEKVARFTSFAEIRYDLKKRFKKLVKKVIPFKKAQTLLIGMSTGDLDDTFISYTFSRFGLNHLLAISGFHFSLLALFVSFLFGWTPEKVKIIALGIILTAFYLFVGNGPSLQRAWIVAMLYLWCLFSKRMVTSINVLSWAMIIILLLNPFMIEHLGFQFSFWVTFAILLYTKPVYSLLKKIFLPISNWEQRLVQALALGIAVHIAAIPLCLFHFHKFYWSGLILNLIVPLVVSGLLFAFMGCLLLYMIIPFWAGYGLYVVGYFTEKCVDVLFWLPTSMDYCMRVPNFSPILLQIILFLFFLGGCLVDKKNYLLNLGPSFNIPVIEN